MSSHRSLVLAAAQAAGPCPVGEESAWRARVRTLSVDLFVLGDVVARDVQRLSAATGFPATLLGITVEDSSTRGVLLLRNVSGEPEPAICTDRGDTDAGAAMIARAQALVGRRVLVYPARRAHLLDPAADVLADHQDHMYGAHFVQVAAERYGNSADRPHFTVQNYVGYPNSALSPTFDGRAAEEKPGYLRTYARTDHRNWCGSPAGCGDRKTASRPGGVGWNQKIRYSRGEGTSINSNLAKHY
ncbi:hypothetical protein ACTVZO_39450 [Streptomyces sp. IBSNAI002]|uniref:hypothetical protein n=1 Tax=Streptomyces sp. IBSNAI002 TaxID=3457500 RepID=UPI003FD04635